MARPNPQRAAIRHAEAHLQRVDPVMATLIRQHGPCALAGYQYRPFHTLTVSIISQQLSSAAAETIEKRISAVVPPPFEPAAFLSTSQSTLLNAGLSKAKLHYIRTLAERALDGRICFTRLSEQTDSEIVATLRDCPGIGPWTAEMFLIFGLQRLDVLSQGDAGLQRAVRILYPHARRKASPLSAVAEPWRPYRSIASWYLWQFLDRDGNGVEKKRKFTTPARTS